ncbi:hypothetical protein [Streptomyces pseudogriseolus]|uniref:hypothetical protein n=1 Tax=Streptomyces pseudogriseolus TaxID=36817 RepID=UPI00117E2C1D
MNRMSEEKPSAPEQTGPSPQELALNAAMAYRVKAYWNALCDPIIDANKNFIRDNPGILTTVAEIDGARAAIFTESVKLPFFEVTDPEAFLRWADDKGETEWVVRKSFRDNILKKRARHIQQTGECVDSVTGEVIPGVTRNPGGTHISVKPTFTEAGEELLDNFLDALFGNAAAALPMLAPAEEETGEGNE